MKKLAIVFFSTVILSSLLVQSLAFSGVDKEPEFQPSQDWSEHYVNLFKQAIKEKYSISEEILNQNLRIISVSAGKLTDGPSYELRTGLGNIHYLYQIDWAIYNGELGFDILDFSDEQILVQMKSRLFPVFAINSIISKDKASNLGLVHQDLRFPWYNDNNWIYVEGSQNVPSYGKLVFDVVKTVSSNDNKCLKETYNLENGEKLHSEEQACWMTAGIDKTPATRGFSQYSIIIGVILLLIILWFITKKLIVRRFNK